MYILLKLFYFGLKLSATFKGFNFNETLKHSQKSITHSPINLAF